MYYSLGFLRKFASKKQYFYYKNWCIRQNYEYKDEVDFTSDTERKIFD